MHPCSRLLILTTVLSLLGCATARQTYTPDGRAGYTVDCSGEVLTWSYCYQKAGDLCGARGYDLLTMVGDPRGAVVTPPTLLSASAGSARSMLIACKGP
jgi:hypothetical protein